MTDCTAEADFETAPGTAEDAVREIDIRRAGYIDGLRALADVLEEHPEVPLPYEGASTELTFMFLTGDMRGDLAATARAIPCSWRKGGSDATEKYPAYFDMRGELHGLRLHLTAFREAVCTKVVKGTEDREVEEVVTPAVTRKVTKPVEIVEWECHSILAPAADETEAATA
jgi:hypothetical protein